MKSGKKFEAVADEKLIEWLYKNLGKDVRLRFGSVVLHTNYVAAAYKSRKRPFNPEEEFT
jgi:hypothetical protein